MLYGHQSYQTLRGLENGVKNSHYFQADYFSEDNDDLLYNQDTLYVKSYKLIQSNTDLDSDFVALGTTRNEVKNILTQYEDDNQVRAFLADDILEAFTQNEMKSQEYDNLHDNIINAENDLITAMITTSATKPTWKLNVYDPILYSQKKLSEFLESKENHTDSKLLKQKADAVIAANIALLFYCQSIIAFQSYLSYLGKNAHLGYSTALIYAEKKAINLYIWSKKPKKKTQLMLIDQYEAPHSSKKIHLYLPPNAYFFWGVNNTLIDQNYSGYKSQLSIRTTYPEIDWNSIIIDTHAHTIKKNQKAYASFLNIFFYQNADPFLAKFLDHIAFGKQLEAEEILKENPEFALIKSNLANYNQFFMQISALQYAAWAYDISMLNMLVRYIPNVKKLQAIQQLEDLEKIGTEHGSHYNFANLIITYERCLYYAQKRDYNSLLEVLHCKLAYLQSRAPINIADEYCHPHRKFNSDTHFSATDLPRTLTTTSFYNRQLHNFKCFPFNTSFVLISGKIFSFLNVKKFPDVEDIRNDMNAFIKLEKYCSKELVSTIKNLHLSIPQKNSHIIQPLGSKLDTSPDWDIILPKDILLNVFFDYLPLREKICVGRASSQFKNFPSFKNALLELDSSVRMFLLYVAQGNQYSAEGMLKKNVDLIFEKSKVTDYSNRKFKSINAIQFAAWAYDTEMLKMLLRYIPNKHLEQARNQLEQLELYGTEHGFHYDFRNLFEALHHCLLYFNYNGNFSLSKSIDLRFCLQSLGTAQRFVPAHVAQEYSRGFDSTSNKNENPLPRSFHISPRYSFFPADKNLGVSAAITSDGLCGINEYQDHGEEKNLFMNLNKKTIKSDLIGLITLRQSKIKELHTIKNTIQEHKTSNLEGSLWQTKRS